MSAFDTVLIANRGEIACRIIESCHARGLRTVAVFSDADAGARHVALADLAVHIGPTPVAQSYLDPERILAAAARAGAQAVHPGYGFLSENAAFAQQVIDAGLVWIGPPPAAIAAMGDKAAAKQRMRLAGVPCVPGCDGLDPSGEPLTDEELLYEARDVGFPLLVKAAAGGGGRGMRAVGSVEELRLALPAARAEATNAFGSGLLLLERLVENARHVEVQVLADQHGTVVHLGERDCSVQRRHQKVVEEAPCPVMTPELRDEMGKTACVAAMAVDYVGAGTVEFLLGDDGQFYFLEMNTRLQVEHPVTELVTGLDLVDLQLAVAEGQPLPFTQNDVELDGHAMELRLYAEDPAQGYLPQPGPFALWLPPRDARVDHGLQPAGEISAAYDPMVAKIIVHGPSREICRRKALRALDDTVFFGGATNRGLLAAVLRSPEFIEGGATTGFLDARADLAEAAPLTAEHQAVAVAAWWARHGGADLRLSHRLPRTAVVSVDGARVEAQVDGSTVQVGESALSVSVLGEGPRASVQVGGLRQGLQLHAEGERLFVRFAGRSMAVQAWDPVAAAVAAEAAVDGRVRMPMAGTVLAVLVGVGERVAVGQVVARAEAMKLETPLKADVSGIVEEISAAEGQALGAGATVLRIQEDSP
jgi:geranyl-CoA carboxylase alpha subunit